MTDTAGDRILLQLKTKGPQSIGDLGQALGMTAEAARQQLVKLGEQGLADTSDAPQPKGRPRRMWRLTAKGHGRFPDTHGQLTVELIAAIRAEFGEDGVERLIRRREAETEASYAKALAGRDLREKVEALAAIRAREGYMAEWTETDDGFILVENHCPICAAAAACQGFCRAELAVFRAVLGPACTVERTDHVLAGARRCAYHIKSA